MCGRVTELDTHALGAWLERAVDGFKAPCRCRLIAGGRSNLTYELTDEGGRRMVLRRPPLGHVLSSAHDMGREHRIMGALQGSDVPVPVMLAHCSEVDVIGAEFYVMEYVDGAILRDEGAVEESFRPELRGLVADSMIDTLCRLHAVDPAAVGLGELSRHEGYIERQLRRWQGQWEQSRTRQIPAIDEVHGRLSARVPVQQRTSIVHGDYRIDNMVFDRAGEVAAVLDWELCTLGDPLADLGMLMVYWVRPGDDGAGYMLTGAPTLCDGFPERAALLARYGAGSGLDLSAIDFYVAFGYWRLACIAEGVYARYRAGVMGDDGISAERLEGQAPALAAAALAAAERI
jgi:aminoglycoside phosphotransferase (APT) family kinase protein